MRIKWTARFNKSIEYAFTCATDVYSKNVLRSLHTALSHYESLLLSNPNTGAKEPLLRQRDREYRHIVIKPYFKIIYTIEQDMIIMVDLWDTRRNPDTLTNGIA